MSEWLNWLNCSMICLQDPATHVMIVLFSLCGAGNHRERGTIVTRGSCKRENKCVRGHRFLELYLYRYCPWCEQVLSQFSTL